MRKVGCWVPGSQEPTSLPTPVPAGQHPGTQRNSAEGRLLEQESGTSCRHMACLGQVLRASPMGVGGGMQGPRCKDTFLTEGAVPCRRPTQPQFSPLPLKVNPYFIWGNSYPVTILLPLQQGLANELLAESLRGASGKSP